MKEIIEYIKKHPKVKTAFQVDDRIVVDLVEEVKCVKCGTPLREEEKGFENGECDMCWLTDC